MLSSLAYLPFLVKWKRFLELINIMKRFFFYILPSIRIILDCSCDESLLESLLIYSSLAGIFVIKIYAIIAAFHLLNLIKYNKSIYVCFIKKYNSDSWKKNNKISWKYDIIFLRKKPVSMCPYLPTQTRIHACISVCKCGRLFRFKDFRSNTVLILCIKYLFFISTMCAIHWWIETYRSWIKQGKF